MSRNNIEKQKEFAMVPEFSYSEKELAKKLGCTKDQVFRRILSMNHGGQNIFVAEPRSGKKVYFSRPKIFPMSDFVAAPKLWYYMISSDERIPFLRIQFLPKANYEKLIIVPISDVHYGQEAWNESEFLEYVEWIQKNENVFCFLNGDIFENALVDSPGGAIFDQAIRPKRQGPSFGKIISPIIHKTLWAQPGNHEGRTIKRADLDPLFWFCKMFDIPYFDQPVYVDINWQEHDFSFFCQHGSAGARTEGGKLNAAARPLAWTEFTMFYIMGHVHDDIVGPSMRRCRIVKKTKKGTVKEYILVDREQYVIVVPGWMNYWGTYAAKAGYQPTSQGTVAIRLRRSGSYEASS